MAKPIAILYVPDMDSPQNSAQDVAYRYMRELNDNYGDRNATTQTNGFWSDYYWFVFPEYGLEAPRLEVFHEKDFAEIQFNELKELVLAKINGPDKH